MQCESLSDVPQRPVLSIVRLMILLAVVGISGWAFLGANDARIADDHWSKALAAQYYLQADGWRGSEEACRYLFEHASASVAAEPDNIHYRHWLSVYKWLSLAPYADPNTGDFPPQVLPWAREIVEDLHRVRPLCPTYGATLCVAGEIEEFLLNDSRGAEHIRQGYRLAPCSPAACIAAARTDVRMGNAQEALQKLSRAVQLDGRCFPQAASLCIGDLRRADMALALAGDDAGRLSQLADLLAASAAHTALAETAKARVFELLERRSKEPNAPASVFASLAGLYRQRGDVEAAIDHYQSALRKDYDQVDWRYARAKLLTQAGRIDEAIYEADICLRLRPAFAPAKRLIEELCVHPAKAKPTFTRGTPN